MKRLEAFVTMHDHKGICATVQKLMVSDKDIKLTNVVWYRSPKSGSVKIKWDRLKGGA